MMAQSKLAPAGLLLLLALAAPHDTAQAATGAFAACEAMIRALD
jgi:hypothetical protein